jgi:hypothetical protein
MVFNRAFFYDAPNSLASIAPGESDLEDSLRLIEVAEYRPGYHLELVMEEQAGRAVAFLQPDFGVGEIHKATH